MKSLCILILLIGILCTMAVSQSLNSTSGMYGNNIINDNNNNNNNYNNFADWKIWLPWYVSIAVYRWGIFIILIVIPSFFYRQLKYKKKEVIEAEGGTYYDTTDVTVVVAVYDPPVRFAETLNSILANNPGDLIIVGTKNTKGINSIRTIFSSDEFKKNKRVNLVWADKKGKRPALAAGIKATTTKLVALVDDDISWSPNFLQKIIAPFQHDNRIGGVGCRQVGRIEGFFDVLGIMADMRLAVRFLELMATTTLDKGCACISGRTGCYRTDILKTPELYDYLLNEKFAGKQCLSGDDKCITRFIINNGYKTYHQLRSSCELVTTFERGWAFF